MNPDLRQRMLAYYDERAPEYEEAYTLGTGTASIADPEVFKAEVPMLADVVARVARGRILDLACGTAFWLPCYAGQCSQITLFDQSARMLAEARAKADAFGVADRATVVRGDFFDASFERGACDTVLAGFFLSHLTEAQEGRFFDVLRGALAPAGRFLVLDSAWSVERARVNTKAGHQPRALNDGTRFEIYKRYCDRDDFARWTTTYGVTLTVEFVGAAFFAVSGRA